MKKYLYLPLFILLSLSIASCQSSNTTDLQATNEALSNQVNSLKHPINPASQRTHPGSSATH